MHRLIQKGIEQNKNKKHSIFYYIIPIVCGLLSFIFLIYYFIIKQYASSSLWLILIAVLLCFSGVWFITNKPTRVVMLVVTMAISIQCIVPVGRVIVNLKGNEMKNLDYIIVLGAKTNGYQLSGTLRNRCEKAVSYLNENPNTIAVLSGGQGEDETVSEAEAMHQFMIDNGISEDRLIKEEKSKNTTQNIRNSISLIEKNGDSITDLNVGIVSNDYHLKRARYVLAQFDAKTIHCIPAKTNVVILPHCILREAVGLLKEYITYR